MADAPPDDEAVVREAKNLPLPERLVHAHWRVRSDAYADVVKEAGWAQDISTQPLKEFGAAAAKVTSDGNPNALDAGLDALTAFLQKADEEYAGRAASVLANNLVSKGLTARPKTVARASEALLLLIELDAAEATTDALLKGLQGKVPKGVAACVAVLLQAVKEFGVRVIKPSPVLKACSPLFDHKDKSVRDGAKDLAVELTRWLGAAAVKRDLTDKMRDAQKKEVNDTLEAVVSDTPAPTRYLRKDPARNQPPAAAEPSVGAEGKPAAPKAAPRAAAATDVWDMMDPEDILPKLSKRESAEKPSFYQGSASEKWKERLAAFTDLREMAGAARLAPGDFGEVTRTIKKVVSKDANVAVIAEALEAAAALARGLRRDYRSDARMLTPVVLDKFKDKNSTVLRALHNALAAFSAHSYSLADVSDDIATALDHKVPTVQVETLTWLAGCVGNLDKPAAAKLDKALLLGSLRATEASTPAVRDAAFSVLAAAVRCGADLLHVHRAIDGMEAARKKRLQSFLADAANPEAAASSAAARPATAPSAPAAAAAPKAAAAPAGKLVASKPGPLSRSDSSGRAKGGAGTARAAPLDDENFDALELGGVSEDIAAAVDSLVGGGVVALLSNADWKQRLEAVTAAHTALAAVEPDALALHCDAITRQLGIAPGWEERMWQIVAKSFEILVLLAQKVPDFARASAMLAMGAVVSKIADPKLKTPAADVLTAWAEALGPRFITAQLYKRTATHKNPKVTELALGWMATAVEEFGGRVFDVRALINAAKECMSHTNPGVKAAAVRLLGAVHSAFGPAVKSYLTDFKPALLPALEAEFARCPHNPAAMDGVRRVKGAAPPPAAATSGASAAAGGGGGKPAVSVSASLGDGLPRDDISGLVTPQIIKDLSAPEWKVRQAALEALEAVIVAAGKRIGPNVGPDTMMSLKGRLADANKMLVIATLRMIGLMAEALGPGAADRVCRPIFQDMLKCWADQKKQVREAVSKALDAYVLVVPLERMLPAVLACATDVKFPADGRRDALAWLSGAVSHAAPGHDLSAVFTTSAAGLSDKAAEVREAAAQLAAALAAAMGPEATSCAVRALPKAAQTVLLERLDATLLAGAGAGAGAGSSVAVSLDAAAFAAASRPQTAPGGMRGSAASVSRPASRAGMAPPRPAAASSLARAGSFTATTGPLLLSAPAERKEERLAKLPRKALASVGGKDFAADVREAGAEEFAAAAALYFRDDLRARLCCDDFKKHIEAAEALESAIATQLEECIGLLDLLFRWAVVRLCELAPNTSSLLRVLDWLGALFDALRAGGYRLREEEAVLLLPMVIEKSGHNLPAVRERFRRLMRGACGLYPVSKMVALLGTGLASKNTRSRVECLEELQEIIDRHGLEVAERAGTKVLPSVVPLVVERDATLRKSAIEVLGAAYRAAGGGVWRHLGKLTDLQREALEAQFRKTARDMAARGECPGGAPTAAGLPSGADAARPQTAGPSLGSSGLFGRSPGRSPGGGGGTPVRTPLGVSAGLGPDDTTPNEIRMPHDANRAAETLAAEWRQAMAAIGGTDEAMAVAGMKLACTALKDLAAGAHTEDAAAMFAADADRLVAMLTVQVARVFDKAVTAVTQPAPSRACKYALNALMQTFSTVRMARAVAEPTVRAAVGELLLRLLDERVPRIEEGGQLVRALNLLMLKVLENANRTSTFVALLLMLRKPPAALASSDVDRRVRFSDLVVKCLIKLTRTLGASLAGLDVSEVLLTIHSFFMVLGVEEIRRRGAEDDRPLRMVKTVLYELTKVLGPGISAHLTKVPPPTFEPAPIIYAYIELNLQSMAAAGAAAGATTPGPSVPDGLQPLAESPADPPEVRASAPPQPPQRMPPPPSPPPPQAPPGTPPGAGAVGASGSSRTPSNDLKSQLAGIFRKIGDKGTTAEGIEELYAFKQAQPEIDITPHLAKTSDAFQLYIQRGLAKVEAAKSAAAAGGDAHAITRSGSGSALPADGAAGASAVPQSAVEAYQERLQRVKAAHAAGLSTSAAFASGLAQPPSAAADAPAPAAAPPAGPAAPAGSRQNLDALRERMRSIAAKATAEPAGAAARPGTAPAAAAAPTPSAEPLPPAPAEPPTSATAAMLRSSSVSLSELQARMARIRELSQNQQAPAAPAPPAEPASDASKPV